MRLDPISLSFIKDAARLENRSMQEAARQLIAAGAMARRGLHTATPEVDLTDEESMHGRTVAAHLPGKIRHAVARVAACENRSLSSAMKLLLKEALAQRGELKTTGNDAVLQPASA